LKTAAIPLHMETFTAYKNSSSPCPTAPSPTPTTYHNTARLA